MSSTRADQATEDVWPGCVYAWLCTSATVEGLARGRACWAAGQIGESAHPGQRVSAKDRLTDSGLGSQWGAGPSRWRPRPITGYESASACGQPAPSLASPVVWSCLTVDAWLTFAHGTKVPSLHRDAMRTLCEKASVVDVCLL